MLLLKYNNTKVNTVQKYYWQDNTHEVLSMRRLIILLRKEMKEYLLGFDSIVYYDVSDPRFNDTIKNLVDGLNMSASEGSCDDKSVCDVHLWSLSSADT